MNATDIAALEAIVGAANVLQAEQVALRSPGYTRENLDAGLLVRPGSTEEVASVMRLLYGRGIPVVPHGGLTGLGAGRGDAPRRGDPEP